MINRTTVLLAMLCALSWGCKKNNQSSSGNPTPTPIVIQAPTATINAATTLQTLRGFGGANIRGWIADLTTAQQKTAFSPTEGIGLSVVRVRVPYNPSDFALEKPTIDAAKSYGASVIATAWTAPASMKDNNDIVGGKLKADSYAAYAAHLASFCNTVGGVSAISPANEPNYKTNYESMDMTADEVANFVAAQGANCGAPIMAPEPFNMSQTYINTYLSNTAAKANTGFVAGHIYGATPTAFDTGGKEIWMTEHYTNSTDDANIWSGAIDVAKEINNCMNAGYTMYVWWYIRRFYGLIDENGNITKRGYAMAHFARWVRPGYTKVSCTATTTPGVYLTAYKSGTKMVVVIVNENAATIAQNITFSGITATGFNQYTTTSTANLAASSVSVTGSSFSANLPASSITTLVSN